MWSKKEMKFCLGLFIANFAFLSLIAVLVLYWLKNVAVR